jgi:ATP phosphoribosyltransferase
MLRIAVPNKGSLSEPAVEMLREAGYRQRRDSRELVLADPDNDVEFFFLRPRDIAVYVGSGTVDVGITGRDLLLDSGADAVEHMQLGFGGSTFRYAAPTGAVTSLAQVQGLRVATSYEVLVEGHLRSHGVDATVVHLDGAVESAVQLGVADVVADVVSLVEQAVAITPGLESPTVSPLHDRDWAAVRAMVRRDRTNQVMDALYDVGARAILVTSIHACRI